MFNVTQQGKDYFLDIPDAMLGRRMLVTVRFTSAPANTGQYGGEQVNQQTVYFERVDNKLLLRSELLMNVGDTLSAINRAVEISNANPIIGAFKVEKRVGKASRIKVTEFFNDGRYDVYGSDLFVVTEQGRRNMIRRYRPLPAPESAEELEKYFSEMRPRAFRMRDDGKIVVLESSYESWLTREGTQTRDRYYVRLLNENGTAVSSSEIEIQPGTGLNCAEAVLLGDKLVAVPQGMEILFFGLDGKKQFSVTAPFPIREICGTRDGRLAVILKNDENLWLSVIHPGERTASMPQQLPKDVHGFCAGETADRLLCMQNTDILCYSLQNGTSEKLVSLLTVEAVPSTVSAFFAGKDGSLHFLLRGEKKTGAADNRYLIASPCEIPTERRLLRIGFEEISDQLLREIVSFNRETRDVFLETVDCRNLGTEMTGDGLPGLLVMNEQSYERLEHSRTKAGKCTESPHPSGSGPWHATRIPWEGKTA